MKAPSIYVVVDQDVPIGWSFDEAEANAFGVEWDAKSGRTGTVEVRVCPPVGPIDVPCPADERARLEAENAELTRRVETERKNYTSTHAALCERNSEINTLKREQAALVKALGEKEP